MKLNRKGIDMDLKDFEPDELWALAQMVKRIDHNTIMDLSKDDDEAANMKNGIVKLSDFLSDLGYNPR